MATGHDLIRIATTRVGQNYRLGALVPKNNPNWNGPWDCAEYISWCVYQTSGILYGCANNNGNPATAEAYTGYWRNDVNRLGIKIDVALAAKTVGAIVLRYPISNPQTIGHIVLSDGTGGTVEAKSARDGVRFDTLTGRRWDTGILIPGIDYTTRGATVIVTPPTLIFKLSNPLMRGEAVYKIQLALSREGFDPGSLDGIYGKETIASVLRFQRFAGLVADGEVGPQTAAALGIKLPY
ncbi:peptidoglycan-binding protein [Adhaeribacter sp. BT258]|uniref:Peptidoglycan-binding protein n=1 Tax=Adhaeribacter terrigena TaxID=2793070 RepID=A0ABS1C0S9_9BACT|nr:peptidoglycan-binding domain-containing protein [Adhaeribacter terrigena]MBK0403014.1 peptidoglycan-binding protein [Adhaeribacter terrigena]